MDDRNIWDVTDSSGAYIPEFGPSKIEIVKDDTIFLNLPRYPVIQSSFSNNKWVGVSYIHAESLAHSKLCKTAILKYNYNANYPWYTFQFHPERDWEYSCPESALLIKNLLEYWGFIEQRK